MNTHPFQDIQRFRAVTQFADGGFAMRRLGDPFKGIRLDRAGLRPVEHGSPIAQHVLGIVMTLPEIPA